MYNLTTLSGTSSIGSIDSPLSLSITCLFFHSRLKTFLFCKSFPPAHKSTQQAFRGCKFVQLNHPAYSSHFAASDYFLIRNLKYHLRGTWFTDDEWLAIAVETWFESQNRKFYFPGTNSWEEKLKKCIDVAGQYVEKWQYVWFNMLIFYSQVAKLFDRPSYVYGMVMAPNIG